MQDGILGIWGPKDLELHFEENGNSVNADSRDSTGSSATYNIHAFMYS